LRLIHYCLLLWMPRQQLLTVLGVLSSLFKTSAELRLENLVLRHQLGVLRRSAPKQLKLILIRIQWETPHPAEAGERSHSLRIRC
jgi:hypothetical protein